MDEKKPDQGMDAVDEKQQIEITKLQGQLRAQEKLMMLGAVILTIVIIMAVLLASGAEISCPHKECPHHLIQK